MNEPQSETIDGYTFRLSQLPGMRGLKAFTRLTKLLGTGLGDAFKAKTTEDKGVALLALLRNVNEDDVEYLTRELLAPCVVTRPDGQSGPLMPVFDQVFQGKIDTLFKVIVFALKVNYGDFLKGLGASVTGAQAGEASKSSSLPT